MSFPFVAYSNFDRGTLQGWDSESDTGALLDLVHYTDLARLPESSAAPYRGAFCVQIAPGDTNDHTLTEGDVDIASASVGWSRFYLNVVRLSTTAQDLFAIYELQSPTSNTLRTGIYLRSDFTGGATRYFQIGVGGNEGGAVYAAAQLETNRWHCIELETKPGNTTDVGQAIRQDNGAATLYVNAYLTAATSAIIQTGGADASVGQAVLGTQDTVATTTGVILLDEFVHDDERIWPLLDRWPQTLLLVATGHAFVGAGRIENVSLLSGGATNNRVRVYDTDRASSGDAFSTPVRLRNTVANEMIDPAGMPIDVKRGCYVVMEGTEPNALVKISRAVAYGGPALVRRWGRLAQPKIIEP